MGASKFIKAEPVPKRVMGVDCSSQSFAFAIFDEGELVRWGEIRFSGKTAFHRLADGQNKVRAMKDMLQADKILIESAIYVQSKKTVITLAYSLGAIIAALINSGGSVDEISPTAWQYFIGNKALTRAQKKAIMDAAPGKSDSWYKSQYREARKQWTKDWVKKKFGVDVDSDNVADAIGIGWYGVETSK